MVRWAASLGHSLAEIPSKARWWSLSFHHWLPWRHYQLLELTHQLYSWIWVLLMIASGSDSLALWLCSRGIELFWLASRLLVSYHEIGCDFHRPVYLPQHSNCSEVIVQPLIGERVGSSPGSKEPKDYWSAVDCCLLFPGCLSPLYSGQSNVTTLFYQGLQITAKHQSSSSNVCESQGTEAYLCNSKGKDEGRENQNFYTLGTDIGHRPSFHFPCWTPYAQWKLTPATVS